MKHRILTHIGIPLYGMTIVLAMLIKEYRIVLISVILLFAYIFRTLRDRYTKLLCNVNDDMPYLKYGGGMRCEKE